MASTSIPRELQLALGVGNDPHAFVTAMLRQHTAKMRTLLGRVATRKGLTTHTVVDADPTKAGNQTATIDLRPKAADGWAELGAKIAVAIAAKGAGPAFVDEAMRMSLGQPPGRSLDDGQDELLDPTVIRALTPSRGLFGLDDAALVGLVLAVGVPILVALIPIVLPLLIEGGKAAFAFVVEQGGAVVGQMTGQGAAPDDGAPPPPKEEKGPDVVMLALVAVGAWLVLS